MAIRFDYAILEVGDQAGLDTINVSADKDRVKRYINLTREEIGDLPYKFKDVETREAFQTVANITAGTCKLNKDAIEVTGAATSWDTTMENREFHVDGSTRWYRILKVTDTTHLNLERPWQEANVAAGTNYKIWKKYYEVPRSLEHITEIKAFYQPEALAWVSSDEFLYRYSYVEGNFSNPTHYTTWDTREDEAKYTTGTLTSTANVDILNGVSTVWTTNILPGDTLTISAGNTALTYDVERVLSDTQLRLVQKCTVSSGGISYTAMRNNVRLIQFFPAIDGQDMFQVRGYKQIVDLKNDEDQIEEGWWQAVRAGAIAKCAQYMQRPDAMAKEALFDKKIADLVRNQSIMKGDGVRLVPQMPYVRRYRPGNYYWP